MTSRGVHIPMGVLLLVSSAAILWWLFSTSEPVYDIERNIRYGITVENATPNVVSDATLLVRAPVDHTGAQRVTDLSANLPFTVRRQEHANQLLQFELPPVAPYSSVVIQVSARLEMAEEPNNLSAPDSGFVQPAPGLEADHEAIQVTAEKLNSADTDRLATVYEWVRGHVEDTGYDAVDRGALHALETGEGDCSEFAYLNVALARAMGIPARVVEGYHIKHDSYLDPAEFHTWAEFWNGSTWVPADSQKEIFASQSHRFLAMRIAEGKGDDFAGQRRFAVVGNGLRARLN